MSDEGRPRPDDAPEASGDPATEPEGETHEDLVPDEEDLEAARAQATDVLSIVGVTRVVCVDDDFAGSIDDLKAACAGLPEGATISCLDGLAFDTPPEIWGQELDQRWAGLADTQKRVALADAREKSGALDTGGQLNAGALWSVLAAPVELLALTPDEWLAREDDLIAEAATHRTLVLFDKELGDGHDGLKLAIGLYAKDYSKLIWAGLFTHTTTIAEEHDSWATMAAEPGIVRTRFVVLSKQHLGPHPESFPQALKVALMTRPASVLREAVEAAIDGQVQTALTSLKELSPSEFERIVFGLTAIEGQWEVDMLLRMFDAFLRTGVREALHTDQNVREAIGTLRALAEAVTLPTADTTNAEQIYRRELYEVAAHLNTLNLPVEMGDIFQTEGGKTYILVLQPCDLMVRANGKRNPDLQYAGLLKIQNNDPNSLPPDVEAIGDPARTDQARPPQKPRVATFELPAFNGGAAAWVRLDRAFIVPIEALDFCVFDPDGKSVAPAVGGAPTWLLPGWAKRYDILANTAAGISTALAALHGVSADNKKRIASATYGRLTGEVKIRLDGNEVSFDLQRIGRLRNPYARALLTHYAVHVARDAYDRPMV